MKEIRMTIFVSERAYTWLKKEKQKTGQTYGSIVRNCIRAKQTLNRLKEQQEDTGQWKLGQPSWWNIKENMMKLTLNKNESQLIKCLLSLVDVELLSSCQFLTSHIYDMDDIQFSYTFKTLEHKIQKELGKFDITHLAS